MRVLVPLLRVLLGRVYVLLLEEDTSERVDTPERMDSLLEPTTRPVETRPPEGTLVVLRTKNDHNLNDEK